MLLVFQDGNTNNPVQELIGGAIATTLFILFLGLYYKTSIGRVTSYKSMPKLTFLIFLFIRWIKKSTMQLLGERYKFAIPFFIYIVFYFWGSSFVSMFGFKGISAFIVVPLTVSTVVFFGTIFSGIVSKGWGFAFDYFVWLKYKGKKICPIPDPLKVLGELGKIISLGLRLWGNYFAGSLILFIVHHFLSGMIKNAGLSGSLVSSLAAFPLHLYFDIVDGALHSMIFLILTLSYWVMARQVEHK